VSGVQEPEDVLDAVRQLESQLDDLRLRARQQGPVEPQITNELREMRDEAMNERRAVVDDLRMIVDLVAAGAERTSEEISSLKNEVRELRELADTAMSGAKFEVRMHTNGHAPVSELPTPVRRPPLRARPGGHSELRRPDYPLDPPDEAFGA